VSDKQALKDKLEAYIVVLAELDELDSDLSAIDNALGNLASDEPRACDFRPMLQTVGDAFAELLEAVRERSEELENELDALGA
jgi:chaperonin cofactor prefoldin